MTTLFIASSMILFPNYAFSSTISSVGGPSVKKGQLTLGARVGYSDADVGSSQDQRVRSRLHADYGLTDVYAVRLVFAGDKRKGDNFEAERLGFENRFHLLKAKDHGFDLGLRLNYTVNDGDKKPDVASVRFYQQFAVSDWTIRFNEIFNHEVGQDADGGVAVELRSQATYKVNEHFRLGVESLNDFGRLNNVSGYSAQDHEFGPVIKGKLGNGLSYETGYRAGISQSAADHNVRLFLKKSF